MEPVKVRVWNYRNISNETPLEFEIRDGITFILGMNNIGKSNILRLFFELRTILKESFNNILLGSNNIAPYSEGVFFDEIVNRNYISEAIKIEISVGENILKMTIKPHHGSLHSENFLINLNFSGNLKAFRQRAMILSDTLYIGAFRSADCNFNGDTGEISIGQQFVDLWSKWAGGDDVKNRTKIREVENELKELLEFKNFGIKVNDKKNNLLITTDDGDFKINELGGGVAQLIMILGNAAIRNPSLILIDEPELSLHPRMQEVLVRALASKAKNGLIASSHSIGLARSVAERTFSLAKVNGSIKFGIFGKHYEPTFTQEINELGYSQFVEVGGNNILLVEGRTDIKSFKEILSKYGIETSFIIISFGGTAFIINDKTKIVDELSELKRLNPKSVSVIFDSEFTAPGQTLQAKQQSFKECCESLGFNVFPTDRNATENYISQPALDLVLQNPALYQQLGPYDNFNQLTTGKWDKNKNWLLFKAMSKSELSGTDLHSFIEKVLMPLA